MSVTEDIGGGGAVAAPPQISLNAPAPPPYYLAAPNAPSQPPPAPPVVDRVAYLDQLHQAWTQAEEQRVQQEAARNAYQRQTIESLAAGVPGLNTMRRAIGTATKLQGTTDVHVANYGYDPQNPATWQDAIDKAKAEAQRRVDLGIAQNPQLIFPGQEQTIGQGAAQFAGKAIQSAQPIINAATTEIPGMKRVANTVGDVARTVGPALVSTIPGGSLVQGLGEALPYVPTPSGIGAGVAESLVPTQVWQAALTLLPAAKARSIPELLSAITIGDTDAITALRNAGKRLNESPAVENVLAKLGSELGQSKIPGEAAKPTAEIAANLVEQRARITQALRQLTAGDRAKLAPGGVKDVMSVAERYAADSPQRAALMEVLAPRIADLPPVNQKFIQLSLESLPSKAARAAATEAQHSRQAAAGVEAVAKTAGTETEKAIAGFKALGGKQAQRFTPIGGGFTDQETADLLGQIAQAAAAKKIGFFDRLNATSAMNLLLTGERLPGVASEATKPLNLMPGEIKLLGRIYGPQFEQAIPKTAAHMSNWEKFFDAVNLPRALVTALDFSAAARQGIVLAARNPVEWGKSWGPMLKAMGSPQGLEEVGNNILKNPKYEDGLIHGLQITDVGGGAQAEEAFISHIASRLPWVRGSERAYVAFLDNLRMLSYEKYSNRLEAYAQNKGWDLARTNEVKDQLAKFLNHATGRGDLSGLEKFTPALNAVFFAPRYFASRPQTVWDMVRPGADKFTRQVAFENLGAFVGAGTAMLEVARLAGADVEVDPRSSDFGRMKIGSTRIDFWGGYQPIARYIAQIASAHAKNASTRQVSFANPGDTMMRFLRSKLSPLGATLYDYGPGKQKDYAGNDLLIPLKDIGWNKDTGAFAYNTFLDKILPLSLQDTINGYQTQGLGGAIGAAIVSTSGGGISSYNPTEKQQQTINDIQLQKEIDATGYTSNLDKAYSTAAPDFSKELGIDASKYKSLSELRKAYIDALAPAIAAQQKLGDKAARTEAGNSFDRAPTVKEWTKQRDAYVEAFWASQYKQNPDLVKRALDNGTISLSLYKKISETP